MGKGWSGHSISKDPEFVIDGKYRLRDVLLGSGGFGEVYLGRNLTNGELLAIKLEPASHERLAHERKIYEILHDGIGIPRMHWYGTEREFNFLVMDLCGWSLKTIFNYHARRFTIKTVLMLAEQLITRVEYLHSKNLIHNDLKPENFVIGRGPHPKRVYLIDFGSAQHYRDSHSQHIPYRENLSPTPNTPVYASINAHLGIELSRRDDMESLGYLLMHLLLGPDLPWDNDIEGKKKISTSIEALCKVFPNEFATYLNYCRGLKFEEEPDYNYLRGLFRTLYRTSKYEYDDKYDWEVWDEEEADAKAAVAGTEAGFAHAFGEMTFSEPAFV